MAIWHIQEMTLATTANVENPARASTLQINLRQEKNSTKNSVDFHAFPFDTSIIFFYLSFNVTPLEDQLPKHYNKTERSIDAILHPTLVEPIHLHNYTVCFFDDIYYVIQLDTS